MTPEVYRTLRVPPQAVEVEKHVIGAMLLDPSAVADVARLLTPAEFYIERHQAIAQAVGDLHRRGVQVDLITIRDILQKWGKFENAGGDAYLMEISSEVVSSANVAQHCRIIRDAATLRAAIGQATRTLELAYNGAEVEAVLVQMDHGAQATRNQAAMAKGLRILSPDVWIPRSLAAYDRTQTRGLSTGWEGLDQLYTVSPAQTNVWTGIPGHGKSEMLDALMRHMADAHGWIIGYFSPENDPHDDHVIKLAEKKVGKPVHGIGRMSREEYNDAVENWMLDHFRWLDQQDAGCTFAQVLALAEKIDPPLNALVVDPWNMLESDRPPGMLETEYILHCLRMARRWVKRTQISLHIVAHPAKLEMDRDGNTRIPGLYEISGSAHWFNTIDNGFTVHIDPETNLVQVFARKIRWKKNGRIGVQKFAYDIPTGRYRQSGPPEFQRGPKKKPAAVARGKSQQVPPEKEGDLPF